MNVEPTKCTAKRKGLGSIETWAIVLLLFCAGGAMGLAIGQWLIREEAAVQVQAVKDAYIEASKAKEHLLVQCVGKASTAAETAAEAANTASQAAKKAETAVESAKQ